MYVLEILRVFYWQVDMSEFLFEDNKVFRGLNSEYIMYTATLVCLYIMYTATLVGLYVLRLLTIIYTYLSMSVYHVYG